MEAIVAALTAKFSWAWIENAAAFVVFLWFTQRSVKGQFKNLQTSFDSFNETFSKAIEEVKAGLIAFGKQIVALEERHNERILKVEAEIQLLKVERVLKAETEIDLLKKQFDDLKSVLTNK